MSFDILLDSSLAKLERGGERNVSHNFYSEVSFSNRIRFRKL